MPTKKKKTKRKQKQIVRNCWNLSNYLMEHATEHLQAYHKYITDPKKVSGCPTYFYDKYGEDEGFKKWHEAVSDMIYYTSNYDLYIEGRPSDEKKLSQWHNDNSDWNKLWKKVEGKDLYSFEPDNTNWPNWLNGVDAIHDKERFLRGRKYFIRYFDSLWI